MSRLCPFISLVVFLLISSLLFPSRGQAEITHIDGDDFSINLGGYASSYFLLTKLDYELPGLKTLQASSTNLFRLETTGTVGENISFDLHNRLILRTANTDTISIGLGATQAPKRSVDFQYAFVNKNGLHIEHDLDRLSLTWLTPIADITMGRQAITWGFSNFFSTTDLWTQFSPFESDTSQKRGVDAIRAIAYPTDMIELDFAFVDRGSLENLSGGLKLGFGFGKGEYYLGTAKNYDLAEIILGSAREIGNFRAHFDFRLPYDYNASELLHPSASIGADYFSSALLFSGEYFYNGNGKKNTEYLQTLLSDRRPKGQSYLLGKHYLGATLGWLPIPELTLNIFTILNILDPSAMVSPSLSYQASDNASIKIGGFIGTGKRPLTQQFPPSIESEFGLGGYSAFIQLSTFL